jgi:hypothetical protein
MAMNPVAPDVLAHLIALERSLLDPKVRADAKAIDAMLDPAFFEFAGSGVVWHRAAIIDALTHEAPVTWSTREFEAHALADGVVLLTFHTTRVAANGGASQALRSSIWARAADGAWRLRFHQATPAA